DGGVSKLGKTLRGTSGARRCRKRPAFGSEGSETEGAFGVNDAPNPGQLQEKKKEKKKKRKKKRLMKQNASILSEHSLSRLIGLMFLQVIENFVVALERVKIIWKPDGKAHDTFNNCRSEEDGPAAVTRMPAVVREARQVTAHDAPVHWTWFPHRELIQ